MFHPSIQSAIVPAIASALVVGGGTLEPIEPTAPTLSDLAPYKVSGQNVWIEIPYGSGERWQEPTLGGNWVEQVFDIYTPTGTPPASGWPTICFFHANSAVHTVGNSGDLFDTKEAALAAGFAFASAEFRHPVVNVDLGAPHRDAGQAVQALRSVSSALSLDPALVFALCRSRGSLAVWEAMQPDMAVAGAGSWSARQSSTIQGVWAYNAQTTYNTEEFANLFVIEAERDDFLLLRPNDARWGSAISDVATAPALPPMAIFHADDWPGGALVSAAAANDVHYPGMGEALYNAFVAAGQGALFTGNGGATNPYGGAVAYFTALLP